MLHTTYAQYTKKRQDDFNALPIVFAYTDDQFKDGMEKLGLKPKDTDKVYRLGNSGGFYKKSDSELIRAWIEADTLDDLMKNYAFCKDAVMYEMSNHEYCINWQGDYDVMSCFGNVHYVDALDELEQYFNELGWSETQRSAYRDARREYNKLAEENDWF